MSHIISVKISNAMFGALTEQALRDGQAGSEAAGRAAYVRKAIKTALNKSGFTASGLEEPDSVHTGWAVNGVTVPSGCPEAPSHGGQGRE